MEEEGVWIHLITNIIAKVPTSGRYIICKLFAYRCEKAIKNKYPLSFGPAVNNC